MLRLLHRVLDGHHDADALHREDHRAEEQRQLVHRGEEVALVGVPDVGEHVVEGDAERDHHEDVREGGERHQVLELADLAGDDQGAEDEEHVPEDAQFVVGEVMVEHLEGIGRKFKG